MESKCLVTKLKGVVENENLPKVGELKVGILKSNTSKQFLFNGYDGCRVGIKGNGSYLTVRGSVVDNPLLLDINKGTSIYMNTISEDGLIYIENKYLLYYFAAYYDSDVFEPIYNLLDLQYSLKLYAMDNRVATNMTGNITELVEKMLANGRVQSDGPLFVSTNGTLTIFNGTSIITPSTGTWYRYEFKPNGYSLYTASGNTDMSGELIYDSTAN